MIQLSDEQLNNLGKETLVVIVSSLQDQLLALQDHANAQLSDNNRQIELLTEQIRLMNQRFFGRKSESAVSEVDGQLSLFDSFNEVEYLKHPFICISFFTIFTEDFLFFNVNCEILLIGIINRSYASSVTVQIFQIIFPSSFRRH